jgi:hypothetical protein
MDNAQDNSTDDSLDKELALEAQMRAIAAELEQLRSVNREAALSDVRTKIKRYKITRTELASSFPVLRKSSVSSAPPKLNADGSVPKKRGRKLKSQTVTEVE